MWDGMVRASLIDLTQHCWTGRGPNGVDLHALLCLEGVCVYVKSTGVCTVAGNMWLIFPSEKDLLSTCVGAVVLAPLRGAGAPGMGIGTRIDQRSELKPHRRLRRAPAPREPSTAIETSRTEPYPMFT